MGRKEQIQTMLQNDPTDVFLRYALGMEYASEKDDANAAQVFEQTIRGAPDYVPAYFQWGQALLRLGRSSEAKAVLCNGIEVAQRVGDAHAAGEMEELMASL